MPFTVEDFRDLLRLLDEHPEWKRELRRTVLADELLEIPRVMRELAEAQKRTEARLEALTARVDALVEAQKRTEARLEALTARVDALAEAQKRTEARLEALTARVDALAEAQKRTEARLEALTARVDALAEAQKRTEARLEALTARVDALAEAQRRTEGTVQTLVAEMQGLKRDVARLKGSDLERRFRERAPALLGRRFRRARVLPREEVAGMLDDAVDEGRLGWEDRDEILGADAVVRARDAEGDVWLVVEVSSVVDRNDAELAARRAEALRGLGVRAVPGVAGERFTEGAEDALASLNALAWRMEER